MDNIRDLDATWNRLDDRLHGQRRLEHDLLCAFVFFPLMGLALLLKSCFVYS